MRRIDKIKIKHKPQFKFNNGGSTGIKLLDISLAAQQRAVIAKEQQRLTSNSKYAKLADESIKREAFNKSNAKYAAEYDRVYSPPPKEEPKSIKNKIVDLYNNGRTFIHNTLTATDIQEKQIVEKKPLVSTDTIPLGINHLYTVKDDHWNAAKKDNFWAFENAWDNSEGFNYQAIPILKNTPSNIKNYPGVQGVAQFILDSDIVSPVEKRDDDHPYPSKYEQWVMYYKNNPDNTTNVKYDLYGKRNSYQGYKNDLYIRSLPLSDIAFDDVKNRQDTGYAIGSRYLTTHDKKRVPIIGHTRTDDKYARFAGGSVVFAFKEPSTGKDIRVDFAGTVNEIQKYGELLQSKYKIDPKNVQVLMLDAGSYSGKPVSINDTLHINQYSNFNRDKDGGGALLIPSNYNKRGGITTTVKFNNGGFAITPYNKSMENKKKNKLVYPDLKTKFRNYIDNINQ